MKIPSPLAFLAAGLLSATVAQSQIFVYNFNDNASGTTTVSTGSNTATATIRNASNVATNLRGASGSGVSGLSGDYAFDNAAASTGMGSLGTGGYASTASIGTVMDSTTSFTLSGWMNPQTQISSGARIIEQFNTGTSYWRLSSDTAGRLSLAMATPTMSSASITSPAGSAYSGTGQWTFFAVTYDGTIASNNVKFYVGGTNSAASLVGTVTLNGGTLGINTAGLAMGGGPTRPMDALLDNLRIDGVTSGAGGALSLAQLETIRYSAIPEPSVLLLIALPIGLGFVLRRKRFTA